MAGSRTETYFGFQQVITGFMVWWVWSIVKASRSQWRAQSWRKRGSLQRQRWEGGTQRDPVGTTSFTIIGTETVVLAFLLESCCYLCSFHTYLWYFPFLISSSLCNVSMRHSWAHVIDEACEAQRSEGTCGSLLSWQVAEP